MYRPVGLDCAARSRPGDGDGPGAAATEVSRRDELLCGCIGASETLEGETLMLVSTGGAAVTVTAAALRHRATLFGRHHLIGPGNGASGVTSRWSTTVPPVAVQSTATLAVLPSL